MRKILIVGAGQAGLQLALSLQAEMASDYFLLQKGQTRIAGNLQVMPARTVCVAAGTSRAASRPDARGRDRRRPGTARPTAG